MGVGTEALAESGAEAEDGTEDGCRKEAGLSGHDIITSAMVEEDKHALQETVLHQGTVAASSSVPYQLRLSRTA